VPRAKKSTKEEKVMIGLLSTVRLPTTLKQSHDFLDAIEAKIRDNLDVPETPLIHSFSAGFYVRQLFVPAGVIVVTAIHKTRHPFVQSVGETLVWSLDAGVQRFQGYHVGITEPGTRRLVVVLSDTVWTTFHETKHTDLADIERELIEPHENPQLAAPLPWI
jgi:hypothetical protein